MTITVLVADDQEIVRDGLAAVLDADPDLHVVDTAADGRQAVERTGRLRVMGNPVDVVLMDIRMPVLDGLAATRALLAVPVQPPTRVLVLTTFDLDDYVYDALHAGASGFLLKDAPTAELAAAVKIVAAGESLLAPTATRRLIAEVTSRGRPDPVAAHRVSTLTAREREVLVLVARGLSNREIAARLALAEETVKTHLARIFTKLDLRDRAQGVIWAYESGLVVPGMGGIATPPGS